MKTLQIQLQPGLAPELDTAAITERLRRLAERLPSVRGIRASGGDEDGPYVHIAMDTEDLPGLWSQLRAVWRADSNLARCSIVVAEGQAGWDDYLLLHHFEPQEPLDDLE